MQNYTGTCKDISSYNLGYNFLIQFSLLQSSIFVVHFSNAFGMETMHFQKVVFRMKLFFSL